MKRFILTLPGKVIAFLVCIFSALAVIACVYGASFIAGEGVYSKTEQVLVEAETAGQMQSDMYGIAEQYFWQGEEKVAREWAADRTNLRYQLTDENGRVVCANAKGNEKWAETVYFLLRDEAAEDYDAADKAADGASDAKSDIVIADAAGSYYLAQTAVQPDAADAPWCCVKACLPEELTVPDRYSFIQKSVHLAYALRYAVYTLALLFFLLAVASFVALMWASGRRRDEEGFFPGPLGGLPFDLLLAAAGGLLVLAGRLAGAYYYSGGYFVNLAQRGLWLLLALVAVLGLAMSAACRIKQNDLLQNTVIWRLQRGCGRLLRRLGQGIGAMFGEFSVWPVVLLLAVISIIEFVGIGYSSDTHDVMILWFIEKLILIPLFIYLAVSLRRLQKGGQALAAGDLDHLVDTSRLIGPFRRHGDDLNNIGDGMNRAVMQRMKSERMKTELITNVSHDIKTPLTSIINYTDLISREECNNEKVAEYSAVLLRQSERLKRLIDDLVEASKAQTGNLEVELAPCDVGVFISQAEGEYQDKLDAAGLTLVTGQPAKEVLIMADGRRLWRVFDNLMNNAAKYSQPGTRVYLTLFEEAGQAVITVRNTSREALNISPDELMERFVRGDSARSTEGNGLGLSIAKSLTELQNGDFDITIDGDLFKVTLRFPVIA